MFAKSSVEAVGTFPAVVVIWLAGSTLALMMLSLLHAVILRIASSCGRVEVDFRRAFTTVLICNVTFYGFGTVMALAWSGLLYDVRSSPFTDLAYLTTPMNFVYVFTAVVLGHAAVFSQRLAKPDEPPLSFGRAAAVAVVYQGLCCLSTAALLVLVILLRQVARS